LPLAGDVHAGEAVYFHAYHDPTHDVFFCGTGFGVARLVVAVVQVIV